MSRRFDQVGSRKPGRAEAPPSPRWTRNTATVVILRGFWVPSPPHDLAQQAHHRPWVATAESERGSGAGSGGNISDAAPRLGPGTPSPAQSYARLGSKRCPSQALASSRLGVRLVGFPSGNLACARNRCESGKGVAGKEQRRGGHSDAALYPEMLGRRRTQAGLICNSSNLI